LPNRNAEAHGHFGGGLSLAQRIEHLGLSGRDRRRLVQLAVCTVRVAATTPFILILKATRKQDALGRHKTLDTGAPQVCGARQYP
jgi:hypothetical protein